jgi:hypothetical protein
MPKRRARARLLAKGKSEDRKSPKTAAKKIPGEVSAARKRYKSRATTKKLEPLKARAKAGAARKNAKRLHTRTANR